MTEKDFENLDFLRFEEIPRPTPMCVGIVPLELFQLANGNMFNKDLKTMLTEHIKQCDKCLALYCAYKAAAKVNRNIDDPLEEVNRKAKKLFSQYKKRFS